MAFCTRCGTRLEEGVAFCGNCGTPCKTATGSNQNKSIPLSQQPQQPLQSQPQQQNGYRPPQSQPQQQNGYRPPQPQQKNQAQWQGNGDYSGNVSATQTKKSTKGLAKKLIVVLVIVVILGVLSTGGWIVFRTFFSNPFADMTEKMNKRHVTALLGESDADQDGDVYCVKYLYGVQGNVYVHFNKYEKKKVDSIVWSTVLDSEQEAKEFKSKLEDKFKGMKVKPEYELSQENLKLIFTFGQSKNTLLEYAPTIELAIKECCVNIAARNEEIYNGGTVSLEDGTEITIPSAVHESRQITVYHVAIANNIQECFAQYRCEGKIYKPYWIDSRKDVCWLDEELKNLDDDEQKFEDRDVVCLIDSSGNASQEVRIYTLY